MSEITVERFPALDLIGRIGGFPKLTIEDGQPCKKRRITPTGMQTCGGKTVTVTILGSATTENIMGVIGYRRSTPTLVVCEICDRKGEWVAAENPVEPTLQENDRPV